MSTNTELPPTSKGEWVASFSGEEYSSDDRGSHWWEAALEAFSNEEIDPLGTIPSDATVRVGLSRSPKPPWELIDGDDITNLIRDRTDGQEDYSFDGSAEFLEQVTDSDTAALGRIVCDGIRAWFATRPGLMPQWFCVDKSWVVTYRQAVEAAERFKAGSPQ